MTIQEVRDKIRQGKLKHALKAAAQLPQVQADEDHRLLIDQWTATNNTAQRNHMVGIMTDDKLNQSTAVITNGLLSLLSELEETSATPTTPTVSKVVNVNTPTTSSTDETNKVTKILFMASSPSDMSKLQLTEEHSGVSQKLQDAEDAADYQLKLKRAVTAAEFQEYIYDEQPNIVHFSGHGDKEAPKVRAFIQETRSAGREALAAQEAAEDEDQSGIFLYDNDKRNSHYVRTNFLVSVFDTMVNLEEIPIKAVVFNACHSKSQAQAVSTVVPYVIGTSWSVGDKAAIAFARGFYFAIARGKTVDRAFHFGVNQALAYDAPKDQFMLYHKGELVT